MKNKSLLTFAFIALLLLISVAGVSAEYVQTGNYLVDNSTNIQVTVIDMNSNYIFKSPYSGFEVCRCGTISDVVEITNTGVYDSRYTLKSDKDYVTFSEPYFEVKAGKTKSVPVFLNMPCDVGRSETVSFSATSSFNDEKVFDQKIELLDCQNLVAGLYETNLEEQVCEPFTTSFRIQNTGAFNEVYHIAVSPFEDSVRLSTEDIMIPAGSSADVFAHYALPCDVYGNHELKYTITATKNQMKSKLTQNLFIPQDYDFSVTGPQSLSVCDRTQSDYTVVLRNNNNFTDTYTVIVDKPSFVDVTYPVVQDKEVTTFDLVAGGEVAIPFSINYAQKEDVGNVPISIQVISENGDITKELITSLDVLNCVDLTSHLFTSDGNIGLCGGDDFTIPFAVENAGVTPAAYFDFGIIDPTGFLSLDMDNTIISGPETTNMNVIVDVPESVNTSYEVDGSIVTYFDYGLENQNLFTISVDPATVCYAIEPSRDKIKKYYGVEGFDISVENEGLRSGTYDVRLVGAPSYLDLLTSEVTLDVEEKTDLFFAVNQSALAVFVNATPELPDAFTSQPKLVFIHQGSDTVFDYDLEVVLATSHPWYVNAWESIKETPLCTLAFFGLAFFALLFLLTSIIRAVQNNTKFSARKVLGVVLIAILLISAIVVLSTQGVPAKSNYFTSYDLETNSTRHLLLEEDHDLEVDMSTLFFDADDDIVTYGVMSIDSEVLAYEIEGNELELTPVQDYNGASTLVLFATDAFNETAVSEDIYVEVLPVQDYSLVDFFNLVCSYVNWIVLALLALFIWLTFSFRKVAQPKNKVQRVAQASPYKKPVAKKKSVKKVAKKSAAKKTTKKATKKVAKKSVKKSAKKSTKKASSAVASTRAPRNKK